jgi:uncharacterized protein YjgD (DUF1641 family)
MAADMATVTAGATVEERLDRLSAQIEDIALDLARQRESRQQWEELAQTLVPVSRGAFDLASRELQDLSGDVTVEDSVRLARTLARSMPQLERLISQLQGMAELGSELASLSGAGFAKAADALADTERKGYFAVGRGGRAALDRVVAAYANEDFEVLGDNLVELLGVAKELATPEMTGLLDRTLVTLRAGESLHGDPPSTFGLIKQLRDPQARRGLARALAVLKTIGTEPALNQTVHDNE